MKKLLSLILCVSLAFAMAVPALASCDDNEGARTSNDTYVKSLYVIAYTNRNDITAALSKAGLPDSYRNNLVGGEAGGDNDFNKGCGSTSYYIRLIYSEYTGSASGAITNLIAVYKDKGVEGDAQITVDGITYYPVSGKGVCYSTSSSDFEAAYTNTPMDFNYQRNRETDKNHKSVYLYYTTDSRAGNPITKLNIYYDSQNRNKENLVKELASNDVCDFNEGYEKSRAVYLQMERGGSSAGSVFNNTTSVIAISAGVVIILAVVGFVIFKKRKGVAQ